jgi:hypothetical protein
MERVMARHMEEIVDESSNQSELAAIVKQYTDIYADYGNYRKQEVMLVTDLIINFIIRFISGIISLATASKTFIAY